MKEANQELESQIKVGKLKAQEQGQEVSGLRIDVEKYKEKLQKMQSLYEKEKVEKRLMEVQVAEVKKLIH